MHRIISKNRPRKAWRRSGLPKLPVNEFGQIISSDEVSAMDTAISRVNYMMPVFDHVARYEFKTQKQAIVVEVSQEDIENIYLGKTPYKILGRITRVRRNLGFPEQLFIS